MDFSNMRLWLDWQFDIRAMMHLLGFKNNKMPRDFSGFKSYTLPIRVYPTGQTPQGLLRTYTTCVCGKHLPVGRLSQHLLGSRANGKGGCSNGQRWLKIQVEKNPTPQWGTAEWNAKWGK